MEGRHAGDPRKIDGDRYHIPVVQGARYEVGLYSPLVSTHPQANIYSIFVLLLIELQPSLEFDLLACDGDLAGEAHEL